MVQIIKEFFFYKINFDNNKMDRNKKLLIGEMKIYKNGIGCMDGNWGDRAASAIIYPETDFFTDAPEMSTVTCSSQGCTLIE